MSKKISKREDSAPLDALRLVLKTQAVQLEPVVNQVSALPMDTSLEYYFLPMEYMNQYGHYHRPGKPFKNLKLINFERPAISLTFFSKHKYSIKRIVTHDEVLLHVKNFRHELLNKSLTHQLSIGQQKELQQADHLLRTLRDNSDAYQVCFSNYHHYYKYWYCSYRYFDDLATMKTTTHSEHLLKHTERVAEQVHERLNIIFIDPVHICKPIPHDNKLIDLELDTYPIRLKMGVTTLYLRALQ